MSTAWFCKDCNEVSLCKAHEDERFWKDAFRRLPFRGQVVGIGKSGDWSQGYRQLVRGYKTDDQNYFFQVKIDNKLSKDTPCNLVYLLHRCICLECQNVYAVSGASCVKEIEEKDWFVYIKMDNIRESRCVASREFNMERSSMNPLYGGGVS